MPQMINIADLDSGDGRSYHEVNNAKKHSLELGQLVELDTGARLFIAGHARDCDGTPLYSLTPEDDYESENKMKWIHGYGEESIKAV
jgi:hypothetical protein